MFRCLIMYFIIISILVCVAESTCVAEKAKLYLRDNVLAAFNFNDASSSSDMTLIIRLSGDGTIYVDEGHPVKYIHDPDNSNIPDTWIQVDFNDKNWKDGISGVGFSDNDDNTITPSALISIWTRYRFNAPNADKIKELIILADYDDAYIAWLNGVRIAASPGAPAGNPPPWNATAQAGVVPNHESSDQAAGKPNKARWEQGAIQKTVVDFTYAGSSALSVDQAGKLTNTWGKIKSLSE